MSKFAVSFEDKVFKNLDGDLDWSIEGYKERGGYDRLAEVLAKDPKEIINSLKPCGMRGRGGAGFPTAIKWSFMPDPTDEKPNYLVCNADEGEPGTCKDRDILRNDPHTLVEGLIIGCHCLQAKTAYVYIRGEYHIESVRMQEAIDQAYEAGYLKEGICDIYIHMGAGAYICGEETALLESLEGKRGQPRLKPPFPANFGLYGCPTTVNNVETIAQMGVIAKKGLDWWTQFGSENNHGTKVFSVSGAINSPKNIEVALGVPLKELIEDFCGGVKGGWDNLQAVIPGGSSTKLLTPEEAETAIMDFDSLKQFNSSLGTAGVVVISKDENLLDIMLRISRFYKHETCGQCTPCREGIPWVYRDLEKLINGKGSIEDIDKLVKLTHKIEGKTICAFADGAVWPVQGLIAKFKPLLEEKLK
ncbi:MAG TPA: NADH-quinone oxidoreductase subunit F [Alphaproteobacteria bacterium]|nr:NADH-quinone oxidoreductase subunit F [Alphaproteobacteria bacterium]